MRRRGREREEGGMDRGGEEGKEREKGVRLRSQKMRTRELVHKERAL